MTTWHHSTVLTLTLALAACGGGEMPAKDGGEAPPDEEAGLKTDVGVDADKKVVKIGQLNDESGPAAAIGKPFANGKRLLAAQINAGGSGLLPEGWTVELVERDHGYNPQKSLQAFNEVKDSVLFIGTSFGTPNTLPLLPHLEKARLVAYPASLSSQMAANEFTPPAGPSYDVEARRAYDWIVDSAGDDAPAVCIVYQQDDYGKDGLAGLKAAAEANGREIASEQTVAPGQKDFTAVVTGLKDAKCTHVLLSTLPSATGPIVGTAAQLKFMPVWVGNTPAWVDQFFNPEVIPSAVFANFHIVQGLPFWGEKVPGMDAFTKAWEAHGKDMGSPDSYILMSYIQGMVAIEAARRAIEGGDVTRDGYLAALHSMDAYDAGGLTQELSFAKTPYVAGDETRILKPDFENRSWTVVADYAVATSAGGEAGGQKGGGGARGGDKTKNKAKSKSKTKNKSKSKAK